MVWIFALLTALSLFTPCLQALNQDFRALEEAFNRGDTALCRSLLPKLTAGDPDESAYLLYYKAMLNPDADFAKGSLQALVTNHPRHHLAQKGWLELGKISLLDRNYTEALSHLGKITDPNLDDKHFWIAKAYYEKSDYTNAIASAGQYLRVANEHSGIEEMTFLTADAYIALEQYNSAINSLRKLLAASEKVQDEQYLRYRYGYAAEMLDNRAEALNQYKAGYELNRFSQLAYLIEDRLFEMRERFGSGIDLSFLYPYASGPLPEIVVAQQNTNPDEVNSNQPDSTKTAVNPPPKEINPNEQRGIYLQAGRFSSQNNAIKLCDRIYKLKLAAQYYKSTQFQDVSWVVLAGPFPTELDAVNAKTLLRDNNIDSFIIQKQ